MCKAVDRGMRIEGVLLLEKKAASRGITYTRRPTHAPSLPSFELDPL
jgi:hypothetical protein